MRKVVPYLALLPPREGPIILPSNAPPATAGSPRSITKREAAPKTQPPFQLAGTNIGSVHPREQKHWVNLKPFWLLSNRPKTMLIRKNISRRLRDRRSYAGHTNFDRKPAMERLKAHQNYRSQLCHHYCLVCSIDNLLLPCHHAWLWPISRFLVRHRVLL